MNGAKILFREILQGNHSTAAGLVIGGADPNFLLPEGAAPIHLAAGLETVPEDVIMLFLRHGADPNLRSSEGETPLHVSAAYGRCEVLRLLLLNGADPDICNQDGQTAADLARQSGCEVCMLTLQDYLEDDFDMEDEHTAFTLEPYEPYISSSLSSLRLNENCEDRDLHGTISNQTLDISSHSCDLEDEDETFVNEETVISSLNSSSSFHTCPSDNDVTVRDHYATNAMGKLNPGNNGKEPPKECEGSRKSAIGVLHPTEYEWSKDGRKTATQFDFVKSKSERITEDGCKRSSLNSSLSSTQDPLHQVGQTCPDSVVADYSPGKSLCKVSSGSDVLNHSERLPKPVDFKCERKSKVCKKEDNVFIDDSLSSCGSAAFIPTDFDSDDLSLNLEPQYVSEANGAPAVLPAHLKSSSLMNCKKGTLKSITNKSRGRNAYEKCFQQPRRYNDALSTISLGEFDADSQDLPRTSSRIGATVCQDLLDNLSLSTITGSSISRSEKNRIPDISQRNTIFNHQDNPYLVSDLVSSPCKTPRDNFYQKSNGTLGENHRKEQMTRHCIIALDGNGQQYDPLTNRRRNCSKGRHWSLESNSSSRNSSTSSVGSIQYLYTDDEDGYSLVETWYPILDENIKTSARSPTGTMSPLGKPSKDTKEISKVCGRQARDLSETIIYNVDVVATTAPSKQRTEDTGKPPGDPFLPDPVLGDVKKLTHAELRDALISAGITPGPITRDTRSLYELKLTKLWQNPSHILSSPAIELGRLLGGDLDTSGLQTLEDEMSKPFSELDPSRKWREGTQKFSFNYLLLDPRISDNLPARIKVIGEKEAFRNFIKAIFYIGKGKRARPYAHFKEAIQCKTGSKNKLAGPKVQRILDIWDEGQGVISLHVFQNVIPVEAYTREAAMIDAIDRKNLTNIKGGEYYGAAATWPARQRRSLGSRLLHKSFRIFMSEGERHIRPADIQGS